MNNMPCHRRTCTLVRRVRRIQINKCTTLSKLGVTQKTVYMRKSHHTRYNDPWFDIQCATCVVVYIHQCGSRSSDQTQWQACFHYHQRNFCRTRHRLTRCVATLYYRGAPWRQTLVEKYNILLLILHGMDLRTRKTQFSRCCKTMLDCPILLNFFELKKLFSWWP